MCHLITASESCQTLTPLLALPQDMHIEVDENGTLDLSMKTKREKMKDQPSLPLPPPPPPPPPPPALPAMSLGEGLPTPVTSMAKASGLHIPSAFYQALCEQEGWDVPLNFSKPHMQLEREVSVFCTCVLGECQVSLSRCWVIDSAISILEKSSRFLQCRVLSVLVTYLIMFTETQY